ncbi:RES family NAD+ phosphorylase [Brachyspira pilosicoli]|uniref:RES family NAD+ phosphorylase n=1 Tax=Brachyspira pilosicoli TaxID=52584 RepID=UPI00242D3A19|nr:RES family NAD+ phosphorylase [Brachyspira pilosicoli]
MENVNKNLEDEISSNRLIKLLYKILLYLKIITINDFNNFKNEVIYNNRFFPNHKIIDVVREKAVNYKYILKKNTNLYRSRIYKKNEINLDDYDFNGYNAENSLAPKNKDNIGAGRINPEKIAYLYLSEDVETCIIEVRPIISDIISVATVKITNDLNIFDLTSFSKYDLKFGVEDIINNNIELLKYCSKYDSLDDCLDNIIDKEFQSLYYGFSLPNKGNVIDYIPTQYISELLKNIGFDGIRFNSSLNKNGINITIFNHENNCEFINSYLYNISDIKVYYSKLKDTFDKMYNEIYK